MRGGDKKDMSKNFNLAITLLFVSFLIGMIRSLILFVLALTGRVNLIKIVGGILALGDCIGFAGLICTLVFRLSEGGKACSLAYFEEGMDNTRYPDLSLRGGFLKGYLVFVLTMLIFSCIFGMIFAFCRGNTHK